MSKLVQHERGSLVRNRNSHLPTRRCVSQQSRAQLVVTELLPQTKPTGNMGPDPVWQVHHYEAMCVPVFMYTYHICASVVLLYLCVRLFFLWSPEWRSGLRHCVSQCKRRHYSPWFESSLYHIMSPYFFPVCVSCPAFLRRHFLLSPGEKIKNSFPAEWTPFRCQHLWKRAMPVSRQTTAGE